MPGLTRGPMCASELGAGWIDSGTLALTQHRARLPLSAPRSEGKRARPLGFTVAYADSNGSFEKAASTWRDGQSPTEFVTHSFKTIADLDRVFRLLEHDGKRLGRAFSCGALFIHSSALNGDPNSQAHGLHAVPMRPRTMAELRYKEEVLAPSGLDIDTAGASTLQRLRALGWASGATLQVVGCLSGGTPNNEQSVAQVLAQSQKVRTVGETGKAYFSTNPERYVPISASDTKIYLRAFHIKMNHLISASEGDWAGLLSHAEAMPQRSFDPP